MADTAITGTPVKHTASANGNFSITVPADAAAIFVAVAGWYTSTADAELLSALNFVDDSTMDFTFVANAYYSAGNTDTTISLYQINQNGGDWPGSGAKTIYFENSGGYTEGYLFHAFCVTNVDATTLVGDTSSTLNVASPHQHTLTGMGVGDLGVIVGWDNESSEPTVDINGQTHIIAHEATAFNSANLASAYELDENVLDATTGFGSFVTLAFAINNGTDAGAPVGGGGGYSVINNIYRTIIGG